MTDVNIHASCVLIASAGEIFGAPPDGAVLLLGESGSGKSRVTLQLIARGAKLVADDRVELFAREDCLWARPPARLAGLLEACGVGIVKLPHVDEARILLAVSLSEAAPRHPERRFYTPPHPLTVREPLALLQLAADDISICDKIVLAAAAISNALFREEGNTP